jgi:hypothetical protein
MRKQTLTAVKSSITQGFAKNITQINKLPPNHHYRLVMFDNDKFFMAFGVHNNEFGSPMDQVFVDFDIQAVRRERFQNYEASICRKYYEFL